MKYDFADLIVILDESLIKIIRHLEAGFPDKALMRALDMHKAIKQFKDYAVGDLHNDVEKKI